MLRNKDNTIISEIKDFFTSSEKAMHTIFSIICSLTFSDKTFGFSQADNLKYSNYSKLLLLLLFPVFDTKSSLALFIVGASQLSVLRERCFLPYAQQPTNQLAQVWLQFDITTDSGNA